MDYSYSIGKIEDSSLHKQLKESIKSSLEIGEDQELKDLHKVIQIDDINRMRIRAIKDLNNNFSAKEIILGIAGNYIKNRLGSDLVSQKKLNLSIQMPQDHTSILDMHTDCVSADSPFQQVLWIPLTKAFSTNSMYICSIEESVDRIINIQHSLRESGRYQNPFEGLDSKSIDIDSDSFLLFSPLAFHGNRLNQTDCTRISLNIRIKNFFAPEPTEKNSDRKLGSYYEILNLSKSTKEAIRLLKHNNW